MWAESEGAGRGSKFTILLPLTPAPRSHEIGPLQISKPRRASVDSSARCLPNQEPHQTCSDGAKGRLLACGCCDELQTQRMRWVLLSLRRRLAACAIFGSFVFGLATPPHCQVLALQRAATAHHICDCLRRSTPPPLPFLRVHREELPALLLRGPGAVVVSALRRGRKRCCCGLGVAL